MSYEQKLKVQRVRMLKTSRKKTRLAGLMLLFAVLALLVGCQPGVKASEQPLAEIELNNANKPRLSFFLSLKNPDGPGLRLQLAGLEIFGDQQWQAVATEDLELDSKLLGDRQLFLASRLLLPGRYERLRFTVIQSSFRRDDGSYAGSASVPYQLELPLSAAVTLRPGDSSSLFLTWDVQASLENDTTIRPSLTVAAPLRQLPEDLVYVACPDIDTIFVVRSDKSWVADSFGLQGQPTYLALDPVSPKERLYVLAARSADIKLVDLSSQRVINSFHIPLVQSATFMTLSPDGLSAYVLDEKNSYLSRLDLTSGQLMGRVPVNYRPQYAAFLEEQNLLAVSRALTQKVSLHDPLRLTETEIIPTGSAPAGLLARDNQLVIAESGANTVTFYDFSSRQQQSRLTAGFTPRRLLDTGDRIYVSNYDDGSVSVIFPGQTVVGREIVGLGRPLEMIYNQTYHRLYVGDEERAGLAIIDTTTDQLRGFLRLGTRPSGMAAVQ